jgi:hypothetical protein
MSQPPLIYVIYISLSTNFLQTSGSNYTHQLLQHPGTLYFSTSCTYVFHVILKVNYHFPEQH